MIDIDATDTFYQQSIKCGLMWWTLTQVNGPRAGEHAIQAGRVGGGHVSRIHRITWGRHEQRRARGSRGLLSGRTSYCPVRR